jgi:2-hydroxy-3-keto-5-methylthiopentenyl-1-phosphate phosphatase
VQLQAGYTPTEINDFAKQAMDAALMASVGATQSVGATMNLNAYLRLYDQIKDLIGAMQDDGFDVWVISASSQYIVEPFAEMVGIPKDHVIGVRAVVDQDGLLTYNFEGCGSVVNGTNDGKGGVTGNSMITYIDGKRCWMNKVIYGDTTAKAEEVQQDLAKRPVFGAGDSDTDVSFLKDSTGLKLAINRNKTEIMCNAYANAGGSWLVNPMFIAPRAELAAGYACSTTACKDMGGAKVPCVDENGMTIPDQKDTSFCTGSMYDEASCQP